MQKTLIRKVGTTDDWTVNVTAGPAAEPHIFHIHVNPFEVMNVYKVTTGPSGVTRTSIYNSDGTCKPSMIGSDPSTLANQYCGMYHVFRDTLFIQNGYDVVLRTHYARYTGEFVLHCHILDHEDAGMMANVQIVADPAHPPAPGQGPHAGHADGRSPAQRPLNATRAGSREPALVLQARARAYFLNGLEKRGSAKNAGSSSVARNATSAALSAGVRLSWSGTPLRVRRGSSAGPARARRCRSGRRPARASRTGRRACTGRCPPFLSEGDLKTVVWPASSPLLARVGAQRERRRNVAARAPDAALARRRHEEMPAAVLLRA